MKRQIEEVKISDIDLDTSQPRQEIDEEKLQDLAEDIKEAGLIVPIILTPHYKKGDILVVGRAAVGHSGARWFVLDGHRRILAHNILGRKKIDAELRFDLSEMDVYEVQFRAQSKRVQVTVREMARAIERYAVIWKREGKQGNITERLSKLTGYSKTYFSMAQDLVNEPNRKIKKLIGEGKVGAYYSTEKKHSTKSKEIQEGMDEAIEEYTTKTKKRVGALTPRVMKPTFKRIAEKKKLSPEAKKKIAKAKTLEYLNRSLEVEDANSNFDMYLYEIEEFYAKTLRWNIKGLTEKQNEVLTEGLMKIVNYFREEKRKLNKMPRTKREAKNL